MSNETCGHPTATGEPCTHPTTENGDPDRCWLQGHNESETDPDQQPGRPKVMDEQKERIIYTAVSTGLKVEDQASLASVSADTLRRHACCIDNLREAQITEDEPCEFCEGYAQAHARGALKVLDQCRPEFRASASFGYVKEEKQDVSVGATDEWRAFLEQE